MRSMTIKLLTTAALFGGLLMSGCGAVRRTVVVKTSPPGAMVSIGGEEVGTTPVSTTLVFDSRDQRILIEIERRRYIKIEKRQHQDDPLLLEYKLEPTKPEVNDE